MLTEYAAKLLYLTIVLKVNLSSAPFFSFDFVQSLVMSDNQKF